MSNERIKSVARLIVTAVLFVNMALTLAGKNPIPFDETAATEWLTVGLGALSTLWIWWKDNRMTKKAIANKELVDAIDNGSVAIVENAEEVK